MTARYAIAGVGSHLSKSTPVLFDGINEKGLMGGLLYFVDYAHYAKEVKPGTLPLARACQGIRSLAIGAVHHALSELPF